MLKIESFVAGSLNENENRKWLGLVENDIYLETAMNNINKRKSFQKKQNAYILPKSKLKKMKLKIKFKYLILFITYYYHC